MSISHVREVSSISTGTVKPGPDLIGAAECCAQLSKKFHDLNYPFEELLELLSIAIRTVNGAVDSMLDFLRVVSTIDTKVLDLYLPKP